MKDSNEVAKLEKAIAEKYGQAAIVNPRGLWSPEDEAQYQQQISSGSWVPAKEMSEEQKDGYLIENGELITKEIRLCSKCGKYSIDCRDNLYLNKFQLCWKCYLKEEVIFRWTGVIK